MAAAFVKAGNGMGKVLAVDAARRFSEETDRPLSRNEEERALATKYFPISLWKEATAAKQTSVFFAETCKKNLVMKHDKKCKWHSRERIKGTLFHFARCGKSRKKRRQK